MSRTRFAPWVVLACITSLAACTSTEGGPSGNTELNIILPNQGADSTTGQTQVECNTVEYTIVCLGGEQPADGFLNPGDGFADAVTLNGNVEVDDNASPPVAQAYMDIPPGDCLVQLRCRDADDEVRCSGDNTLASDINVDAGEFQQVNIVLDCYNISFQAPVGQLDVTGDFTFAVGNFCPDLFVLNCVDSALYPTPQGCDTDPGVDCVDPGPETAGATTCEVRFRDNDDGCNEGCDPQFCQEDANGLLECFPASPPEDQNGTSMAGVEVRTTVTCDRGTMDCLGAPSPGGNACTFDGDQLGSLAVNTEILPNDPAGPSAFSITCNGAADAGATITCEAYTTDGDRDCDKTKIVEVQCPGNSPCEQYALDGFACDSGTVCLIDSCDDTLAVGGSCGSANNGPCCVTTDAVDGLDCSAENPPLAECQGGTCTSQSCTGDADCEDPTTACLVAPVGACDLGTGLCAAEVPGNQGGDCDSSTGGPGDTGTCDAAGACVDNCNGVDCSDTGPNAECTQNVCTSGGGTFTCSNPPVNDCTACCDAGDGAGSGDCTAGVCAAPPVLADVCQQFSPVPVNRVASCDPAQGDECICEKPEFIAVDCELLGNSAPIPLAASVQQLGVAFAGVGVGTLPQAAVVLPSALICSFIGAGFTEAVVDNSVAAYAVSNASVTDISLNSFLDDGTAGGALVSLHEQVTFDFGLACGDNCVGDVCTSDGTTACSVPTFTQDCPGVGTGPGIIAPTFAGSPDIIIPPDFTQQVVGLAGLSPDASVDFDLPYSGIALNLPAVGNPPLAAGCVGGACGSGTNLSPLCTPITRGSLDSPRVMYDATCSKLEAGAGTCDPFNFFSTLGDVCKGAGIDGVADFGVEENLPACTLDPDSGDPICGRPTTPTDFFCTSATAVQQCCDQLAADYPNTTAAQLPQMPVNP